MARGGLYKSEVQKARDGLLAQGKHPSVDAVRIALGNTGSKSTIHRYLKELEAEDGGGVGKKVGVSDALLDLVGKLAARVHEEAEEVIAQARQQCQSALAEQAEVLERQRQEAARNAEQLRATEVSLHNERTEHERTKATLTGARVTIAQLEERAAGLEARQAEQEAHLASLEEKHQHARDALEHFRTQAKEQREQELRRHEHQVQELQLELRRASEALNGKNQELLALNRDNARLVEQHGRLDKDLREVRGALHSAQDRVREHETVVAARIALEQRCATLLAENGELSERSSSLAARLERERTARYEAESSRERLEGRLSALEEVASLGSPPRRRKPRPAEANGPALPAVSASSTPPPLES